MFDLSIRRRSRASSGPNRGPRGLVVAVAAALALMGVAATVIYFRSADHGVAPVGVLVAPETSDRADATNPIAPEVVPQPNEVGFRGESTTLTVIDGVDSAPSGSTWDAGTLRIDADDFSLDRVWVRGGIDYYGTGVLRITNSIVEANGSAYALIWGRSPEALLEVSDSTIVWPDGVPPMEQPWGSAAIIGDARMTLVRNDISGTPDGIQQGTGGSRFEQNYIHDLAILGSPPDNTHNDGIQVYSGADIEVLYNHIELNGYDGTHQNAAVFFAGGATYGSPAIIGNYLSGGGYALRLEQGVQDATVTGNTFGPLAGGFGEAAVQSGVTIRLWSDNVRSSGGIVSEPTPSA